jgi:hypothetical protein
MARVLSPIVSVMWTHHPNSRRFRCWKCHKVHEWGGYQAGPVWSPRHRIICCGEEHLRVKD